MPATRHKPIIHLAGDKYQLPAGDLLEYTSFIESLFATTADTGTLLNTWQQTTVANEALRLKNGIGNRCINGVLTNTSFAAGENIIIDNISHPDLTPAADQWLYIQAEATTLLGGVSNKTLKVAFVKKTNGKYKLELLSSNALTSVINSSVSLYFDNPII